MQAIADLVSAPAESNVGERPLPKPCVNPVAKNPLVGPAKLARTRQNAAAIDPHRKVEIHPVLQSQTFRSELRAAVERHRRRYRVIFRNAVCRYALWKILIRHGPVRAGKFLHFQAAQLRYGINAARAQQTETRAMSLAVFEQVNCADQV